VPIKTLTIALLVAACFPSALAQSPQGKFQHIIIVVQENRTPDNLFASCSIPGADLVAMGSAIGLSKTKDNPHSHHEFITERAGNWPPLALNYIRNSDVVLYCQLAQKYGFANRMFQTNQGPSFPAHQFLISGTSSVTDESHVLVAENQHGSAFLHAGCNAVPDSIVQAIDDFNKLSLVFPCFQRSSILNLLDEAGLPWRYYAAPPSVIWTAPLALQEYYKSPNIIYSPATFIKDVAKCDLSAVTYVMPIGAESDHAGGNSGLGPTWVTSIANAIGNSPCGYWNNTAILVTWDDWGGWYDHVVPPVNHTGWAPYNAYGFRVPLLVISARTPAMTDNVQHDFGSILRFVESNFGLGLIGPGTWADSYADDLGNFFTATPAPYLPMKTKKVDWDKLPMTDPDDD
jgi:phospholipase C